VRKERGRKGNGEGRGVVHHPKHKSGCTTAERYSAEMVSIENGIIAAFFLCCRGVFDEAQQQYRLIAPRNAPNDLSPS